MPKFSPPESFDFSRPEKWPEWITRFERYRVATELDKKSDAIQINTLIYSMGVEAENAFKALTFTTTENSAEYVPVVAAFAKYFNPKTNVIHERAMFYQRSQNVGESAEQYIRVLYELADKCDFKDKKDEQIRDKIVVGMLDKELSMKLQLDEELTLVKTVQHVKQKEMVKSQINKQKPQQEQQVDEVKKNKFFANSDTARCGKCGYGCANRVCPAKGQKCRKCSRIGHFASQCRAKQVNEVVIPSDSDDGDDAFFLEEVSIKSVNVPEKSKAWFTNLEIENENVNFKVDPGADVVVMSYGNYKNMKIKPPLEKTNVVLSNASDDGLKVHGKFKTNTILKNTKYNFTIYVANTKHNLLSRAVAEAMKIVKFLPSRAEVNEVKNSKPLKPFGKFKGPDVHIALRDDAIPHNVYAPRRVPFSLMKPLRNKLNEMIETGVITEVTEPSDWCAGTVIQPKKNPKDENDIRVCADLRGLNKSIKREQYILPTFEDICSKMKGCTVFSKIDLRSGFHQIPLDLESSYLTTFITPYGRFRYLRLPFGIASASEIFQRRMHEVLQGMDGVAVQQDDVCVGGENDEKHDTRLKDVMHRLEKLGAELSHHKCVFKVPSVEMTGHIFSADGVSAAPSKVEAIDNLPQPTNVSELRRVMGMINWLGSYIPHLATVTEPLNKLLKSSVEWSWGPDQIQAFDSIKKILTSAPVLAFYDPNKETVVAADASSYGLGSVLLQRHGSILRPVAYASKSLTDTERRYAQIEKELLALTWACDKFNRYLIGLSCVNLMTDHKPLIPIINSKCLDEVPLRCQKMLMRLMRYSVTAEFVPGKSLVVPDTLSRAPLADVKDIHELSDVIIHAPASDIMIRKIQEASSEDEIISQAISHTLKGWPRKVQESLNALCSEKAHLSVAQGMLLYNQRIVIPEKLRVDMLKKIHDGHQGVTKCRARAQDTIWWPGITGDISRLVESCAFCQINSPKQRAEPMISKELPERPWQIIGTDLGELQGKHFIVMRDYYSRYIEIARLSGLRSSDVVNKMKIVFARHGVPMEVLSDNGPQFIGQSFKDFQNEYNFEWNSSSPGYQQSNGMAESAIKVAKRILRQSDPEQALMIYNSSPIAATGYSPAQLLMGRQIRTNLPQSAHFSEPKWPEFNQISENHDKSRAKAEHAYNKTHGARPLSPLRPGDTVRIMHPQAKQWSQEASSVIGPAGDNPRSYRVNTPTGTLRRNRRHLLHIPGSSDMVLNQPESDSLPSLVSTTCEEGSPLSAPDMQAPPLPSPDIQAPPSPAPNVPDTPTRTPSMRVRQPPAYLKDYEVKLP